MIRPGPHALIGYAYGQAGRIAGCAEAPRIMRELLLLEKLRQLGLDVTDLGDTSSQLSPEEEKRILSAALPGELKANEFAPTYSACASLAQKTRQAVTQGLTPLIVGGDHSLSIGSVAAVSAHYRERGQDIGLLWIDTHGDFNTPETSLSGRIYGMSVAFLTGLIPGALASLQGSQPAVPLQKVAYIGLRDLDPGEKELMRKHNVAAFTMKEIDIHGLANVVERALKVVKNNTAGYVVSFDLDVCDPPLVPGTGVPVRGGLTYREAHLLLELLADDGGMLSFELVELNPKLDQNFVTAELALSLFESAVGKSIL